MKQMLIIGFLAFLATLFVGCAYTRSPYLNSELVNETWQKDLDRDPTKWTKGADRWFLTGDPNATEQHNRNAPYSAAMSTMQVKVPNFTNIVSNGDFELQIFGTYGDNSVYVYGANDEVRDTIVNVRNNTLYLTQAKGAKRCNSVIIRVGVGTLHKLQQLGNGVIEVIQLPSNSLAIQSSGNGNIYMSGNVNLRQVESKGKGSINVFGATTQKLDITMSGMGSVNVSGNVGINNIVHHGKGDLNIIGANSDAVRIDADGYGKIGLNGIVNVTEIQARDNISVLIDCVNGTKLYVYAMNKSRVGLMGNVRDLYIYASGVAVVYGRYMFAQNTYAQAKDGAHINAAATNKIFASATTNGSVYFFGEPRLMSQFVSGNGLVIPVWTGGKHRYPNRKAVYKDAPVVSHPPTNTTGAVSYSYQAYRDKWVNGKLVHSS